MKIRLLLILSIVCSFNFLIAQSNALKLKFNHRAAGAEFELDKTIFKIHNGKAVKLTRAEFYLSGFSLFTSSNDSVKVADSYVLVNANSPSKIHNVGNYPTNFDIKKVSMDCGIDQATNHADPSVYNASHPLGPKDPSMHWGWASGYRFMALEGLVDNNNDGVPETSFQFHNLGDALLFNASLDMTNSQHSETEPMIINLDYAKLFDNLPMTGNLILHGSAAKNKTMMINTAQGGFMSPSGISSSENITFDQIATIAQDNRLIELKFTDVADKKVIVIYNTNGQEIFSNSGTYPSISIDLNSQPQGTYFITVARNGQMVSRKIMIF